MKAAVIHRNGGPEELVYEDLPDSACADDGIVIDVETISIEGGDLLARLMTPPLSAAHVVGYITAGTVREVGPKVIGRRIGERVVTLSANGSHASVRAVPAAMAWAIPDGLSTQAAACVPVAFATAHDCLFNAGGLQRGQTVLIHAGAGGVGMAAIQLAKAAGATVIATASSADKLERLKAFGLDHGINYVEDDFVAAVQALTNKRGVDVVVDSVGEVEIARVFPLAEAAQAHAYIEGRHAFGRVVMTA